MKRLALCALAAFVGWAAFAGAVDIREIQAKLAAQEAALNDIEAKIASDNGAAPEQMISMRKNAKVTVGGAVTTSYFYNSGVFRQYTAAGKTETRTKDASLEVSDADLEIEIEVNENMDAYLSLSLHDAVDANDQYGLAEAYWVRWKNIADTGFGLKAGRDAIAFGDGDAAVGYLYNFTHNDGDGHSWWWEEESSFLPHNSWDWSGVTQIAPYWEGLDGKLLIETSFFAHMWNDAGPQRTGATDASLLNGRDGDVFRNQARNYGVGSMSARATWTPIEDLHFSASAVNYHSNGINDWNEADELAKNNTAVALSFAWRPGFFNRMNIWSQYVHGWNVNHYDGADSDTVNFGVSFDLNEKLTVFAQGDYLHSSFDFDEHRNGSGRAWAAYAGVMYDLGNGAWLETGWRHEAGKRDFDDNAGGWAEEKIKNDTIYASLGFEF